MFVWPQQPPTQLNQKLIRSDHQPSPSQEQMENTRGWTVNKWMKNSPKKNRKPKLKKETLTHVQKTKQEHKRERGQLTLRTGQCHPKWLRQTDIWRHNSRIMKHRRDTHTHSTEQYNTTVTASRFLFSNSKPTSIRLFQWLDMKVLLDVQLDFLKLLTSFFTSHTGEMTAFTS